MNAIEDSEFSRAWADMALSLPKPKAILCVSAHWQTAGTRVTVMEQPKTIHDFYGFPPALFEKHYPAPGSPELAHMTQKVLHESGVKLDSEWGLDHGTWAVLCQMYPKADVPVVQLSLDERKPPADHYQLGQELKGLRKKGVLVIGSGNIVHNLSEMAWEDTAYDWAVEFDTKAQDLILSADHKIHHRLQQARTLRPAISAHARPLLAAALRPGSAGQGGRRELLCREGDAGVDVDALGEAWLILHPAPSRRRRRLAPGV
jgi:4,5-DOPA dioxygenase extradiol